MSTCLHLLVSALLLVLATRAEALHVVIDYTGDTFFTAHPDAKQSLEDAATDLGNAITTVPGAVNTNAFTGTSGSAFTTFTWTFSYLDPADGAEKTQSLPIAADTVVMHVGFRDLLDSSLGDSAFTYAKPMFAAQGSGSALMAAIANAQALSNTTMTRSGGPILGSPTGSIGTNMFALKYGSFGGSVWFDNDFDNDNNADVDLSTHWNFDHTQPAAGKYDFYSVALREMVKTLGFGVGDTWTGLAIGTTWNGANAAALQGGSGANLLTADGFVNPTLRGSSLLDGSRQEAAMAFDLPMGVRQHLTTVDTAFLQDLGYGVVPEPGTGGLLAIGAAIAAARRRRFRLV